MQAAYACMQPAYARMHAGCIRAYAGCMHPSVAPALVINTNWHPISYRFEVITGCCSNFAHFAFQAFLWGLGVTFTYHLRLIWKLVVDFLFVAIALFSLGVTTEVLRANIVWKSAFLKWVVQFRTNFHIVGSPPWTIFARIYRPVLIVFRLGNFVTDVLQVKCNFRRITAVLRFWALHLGA